MNNEETEELYELHADVEKLRDAVAALAVALWILVPLGAVAVAVAVVACALGH